MAWASCRTATTSQSIKEDTLVGINTELVKYAWSRKDTTTLAFVDGDQLHIQGDLESWAEARDLAEQNDAVAWGR